MLAAVHPSGCVIGGLAPSGGRMQPAQLRPTRGHGHVRVIGSGGSIASLLLFALFAQDNTLRTGRIWLSKISFGVPSLSMARRHELPSERVTNALRQRIKAGEWEPGEALPTVTELAAEYQVSRASVGKALAVLSAEGLVVTRHRWGSFIPER
jgi:hypothetical protein